MFLIKTTVQFALAIIHSFQGWHEQIGGGAIADAILDRIIPGAYKMEIQGDVSMRQRLADTEE